MKSAPPIQRPTARVLVIDREDRVLLFRVAPDMGSVWITPGGALEPGESPEQAAMRELSEETGISVAQLSPCVWTRTHRFRVDGLAYEQGERFYVARVPNPMVTLDNMGAAERPFLRECRWWRAEEIAASRDVFAPRSLGILLLRIIAGDYSAEPLNLDD